MKLEHACLDDDFIFGYFCTNSQFGNIQCAPEFDVEAIYGHMRKYAEYGKFRNYNPPIPATPKFCSHDDICVYLQ